MGLSCGQKEKPHEQHRSSPMTAELFVNSDQTQVVYAQGSKLTWTKMGSRQVTVIGEEEKRAFTVVVSISNSGELLPFQAIYQGQTAKTCPSPSAKDYDAAKEAGFRFESSKTKTYFRNRRPNLVYPNRRSHPNIILNFVPGGTTGVWQACDVGMQRIFKHSLKRSYHEDVVKVILKQIEDGADIIEIDKRLAILRDQSVSWTISAI